MPFPRGNKHFFFRARRSIFLPGKLMVSLPPSPSQKRIMLNPAQGQGHSICLGFSFSPAPSSLLPARGLEGCGTWTDVQHPQGRCAPAPDLPPGSCYCRYQAGGGSLTCSPLVRKAGREGEQGGNQPGNGQTRPALCIAPDQGRLQQQQLGEGIIAYVPCPGCQPGRRQQGQTRDSKAAAS